MDEKTSIPSLDALADAIRSDPNSGVDPWEVYSVISEAMKYPSEVLAALVELGHVVNLGTGAWNAGAPAWHPDKYALRNELPKPKPMRVWRGGDEMEIESDYLGRPVGV